MTIGAGPAAAAAVLAAHGHRTDGLVLLGAGAQHECYGTARIAVLLARPGTAPELPDVTGYAIPPGRPDERPGDRAVLQWMTERASDAGVRTPRVLAQGTDPLPYALVERAHGTLASAHPRAAERAPAWFARLGQELRKTHRVETPGFGQLRPDGSGGCRGRFRSWADYLDRWLEVHLCVGRRGRRTGGCWRGSSPSGSSPRPSSGRWPRPSGRRGPGR